MNPFLLNKLTQRRIWNRILNERLAEPIHLNLLSLFVWLFGSYRAKINHDLIIRQNHAYSILKCADYAKYSGLKTVSLLEFGVASGLGLLNMCKIAQNVSKSTGISFNIYGFDTGKGMPPAVDYRDHPDIYQEGDFPMNFDELRKAMPTNASLLIGDVSTTVESFISNLSLDEPIGYVVLDVDYYSSAREALKIFLDSEPGKYLPITLLYADDVALEQHNGWCGELLAINEFNADSKLRKIEHHAFFENSRIYRRAEWLKHIFFLHVLDHPTRCNVTSNEKKRIISNPYLT